MILNYLKIIVSITINMQTPFLTININHFLFDAPRILLPHYINTLAIGDIIKLKVGQRSEVETIYCRIIGKTNTTVTVIDLETIENNNNITFVDREDQYVYPRKKTYAKRKIERLILPI